MARDDLQSIDLTDFSRGISTRYHSIIASADQPAADGFAREEGTWGCFALPDGGLAPMPRYTIDRKSTIDTFEEETDRQWPTKPGDPELYDHLQAILDARVVSPVVYIPALTEEVDRTLPPVDVFMVRQFWLRRLTGSEYPEPWWFLSNHLEYLGPPYTRDGSANLFVSGIEETARNVDPSRWTFGGGSLTETRTVSPDVTPYQVGSPVIVAGMGGVRKVGGVLDADTEGIDTGKYVSYPDYHLTFTSEEEDVIPYTEAYDRPWYLPAPLGVAMPGIVFGHQGRLMALARTSGYKFARRLNYHGNDDGQRDATELVLYWPPNDIYDEGGPAIATFMEEASTGYGSWCSVNANSLLLVKNAGGAVQLNGDVDNPQVVRLPGVPSVGGKCNRGVMTERGYVYGTVSGVWLWTGSDSAEPLSDNLRPLHWLPDDPTIELRESGCLVGSFAYAYPYVYAPNNYVLDMRGGGWWRYAPTPDQDPDDGITFAFNEVDCNGNLWAFPASLYGALGNQRSTYCRMFERNTPRSNFAWRSQPLSRTRNRYLAFRQVTLVASGRGTVEVEVFGIDGHSSKATFEVDGDHVAMSVQPISVTTTDVEVAILSTATDDDMPAPIVHRVSLGYREAQGIDSAGTIRGG